MFFLTFQHPFEHDPRKATADGTGALEFYAGINWNILNRDSFERHDESHHDFYFFEIQTDAPKEQRIHLIISGVYTDTRYAETVGAQLRIDYEYPQPYLSRGFLGIGAGQQKWRQCSKHMTDCSQAFAQECLLAFIGNDHDFLIERIIDNIPDD